MTLIRGWAKIQKALDVKTEETARAIVMKYGIPLAYLNGRPTTTEAAIEEWFKKLCGEEKKVNTPPVSR